MKEGLLISMERSREARRSNLASENGLSKRRKRSSSLRDSHEEEVRQMDLQDTARLRDRAHTRDRDRNRSREFSNHRNKVQNKRRRGESLTKEINREPGESTEERVADDEEYEIEERRVTHFNSHNTPPLSSSLPNHKTRKTLPPTRPVKQASALKAADEMIGVFVPRKARSASVKRSHENWESGNGGFWEDHRASTSTASRSAEANSSSSSSHASVRKKIFVMVQKPNGPKTRPPKASKSSSSVQQDDIEIEIAEVLFGLKKQSQKFKNEDDNTRQKLKSKDVNSINQESKSSVTLLSQNNSPASDALHAPKKNKVEVDNSSNLVENSSMASLAKYESEIPEKIENSSAPESLKNAESCEASQSLDAAKKSVEQEEVTRQGFCSDRAVTERNPVSDEKESTLCAENSVNLQDSTVTKANWTVLESHSRKDEKFNIDLMAPPPMADDFNDLASDPNLHEVDTNSGVKDENMKKETAVEEVEEKTEPIGERHKMKFDLEKTNRDNGRESIIDKLQILSQKQLQSPFKSTILEVEKSAQSSSAPLQIAVANWTNGLPHMGGYMPTYQAVVPMDGSAGSAIAQQPSQFVLSQPRPKRCSTHHYIARNIYLNQQLTKTNCFWPRGAGSAPSRGGKPSSINVTLSAENLIHGNPLQRSSPVVSLNSVQDKGQAMASFPAVTQNGTSFESVNFMSPAQRKQPELQQAPQPSSTGNFLHAPTFFFPLSQQQAAVTAANQSGHSKSATSNKSTSLSMNSTAAFPKSSASLPPVAAAVNYSYPNMIANEAPYVATLQNNGYPYPVPTPIGAPPAIIGSHSQVLPFFNGSYYSSQIFHHSQLQQQQQPNPQPPIQAHQNTNMSSASSSSSYKKPQSQQPRGMPVSGSNILSSSRMQPQQQQKQHVPPSNQNRKLEAETSGENTPSHAESRVSHDQTSMYVQNFSVPPQPLNFAFMPSSAVSGGSSSNHAEKQQESQQKSLNGGVELIPHPQAFAYFSGSNTASNVNFSSMPQNPAVFQSQGYRVAPAAQVARQKNHQMSEMNTRGGSSNHDNSKRTGLGKLATTNGQTLVIENPAGTLNFVSSPSRGNWPSRSITQTAITTNSQVASNSSQSFYQNQLLQHQKQQMLHQSRSKPQTTASQHSSSIAAKLSNNGSSSSQSPQMKNSTRTLTRQVPPTPVASSKTSNLKHVSQQVKTPQGQIQISFDRNSKSGLAPQGQQIPTSNQSPTPSPLVVGSTPSGGNLGTISTGSKAGSSIPTLKSQDSQQTENSSASTAQKSSPVCGRNVPSILSTCSNQLSELKY